MRKSLALAVGAMVVYVAVPSHLLRLCLLGFVIWVLGTVREGRVRLYALVIVAALMSAGAFVLNPVSALFEKSRPWAGSPWVWFFFGALWLTVCVWRAGSVRTHKLMPRFSFLVMYLCLLLGAYALSWPADLPYGGDEVFHIVSAQIRWLMLHELVADPLTVIVGEIWLVTASTVLLLVIRGKMADVNRVRRAAWVVGAVGLLGAALCLAGGYSEELVTPPVMQARIYRYPAAQSWISTALGALARENWERPIFSNEMTRLLPPLALLALGLILGGDHRWRRLRPLFTALAVWGVVTIPTLLFFGTILYLELPAVLLLCVILLDADRLLRWPFPRVCQRPSWWAVVLLGFMKETVLPGLVVWLAVRGGYQWCRRRRVSIREPVWSVAFGELIVWCCALAPALLYLWIRSEFEPRAYAGQWSNICNLSLWSSNAGHLLRQFGLITVLAVAGGFVAWRAGRRAVIWLAVGMYVGMQAFLLGDKVELVGLARFNLLLLPPVIVLAWEALTHLFRRDWRLGLTATSLLLIGNFLMSPVDRTGQRSPWGPYSEHWYPYRTCLADVRDTRPDSLIMLGNMPIDYGHTVVTTQLGWSPRVRHVRPFAGLTDAANLERTLAEATRARADVVIYRTDENPAGVDCPDGHGFAVAQTYPAKVGGLILFVRSGDLRPRQ